MKTKKNQFDRTAPEGKKVAVIWTRVSTKEQADNNLSLETQEKACLDYAQRNGIEVAKVMGQTNESAKTEGKGYQEMIRYVAGHRQINTILVYSYDRFSRAGADAITTKAFLKEKGINLISVTQPIDSDSDAGEFMENLMFLFNQFENNLRKGKCTAGMISTLEAGEWYSKPPIGYDIDRSSCQKHTLIINAKGELIRKAFVWKAEEEISDTEILKRLKALGLVLTKQHLSNIFHNPFYCGKIKHSLLEGRIVQGKHPAIVSEEIYNKVNGIDTHSGYDHSEGIPAIPLKMHLVCPTCGGHMSGYEATRRGQKTGLWYYKCSKCKNNISANKAHAAYAELLARYQIPAEIQGMVKEQIEKAYREKMKADMDLEAELKAKKSHITKQKEAVMTRFGLNEIPSDVYTVTVAGLNDQLETIESKLIEAAKFTSNHTMDVDAIIATCCKLADLWKEGSFEVRQRIQDLAYPDGVNWSREDGIPRTISENAALRAFRSISDSYKIARTQKKDKPCDLSYLVDQTVRESNLDSLSQ